MKNLVFVVTHKKFQIPQPVYHSPYQIVVVGSGADLWRDNNIWRDCEGINIADKNSHYCELTAHYYVWKNKAEHYDVVGLCHYRRFFTKNRFSLNPKYFLTNKDIDKILLKYDIILPMKVYFNKKFWVYLKDENIRCIFEKDFPEYLSEFDKIREKHSAAFYNMFIMKAKFFHEYSEFLFRFLAEYEKINPMTDKNKRGYGYLSEYLLNIWVSAKKLRVKYIPVAYVEASKKYQLDWGVRSLFHLNGYNIREKLGLKRKKR